MDPFFLGLGVGYFQQQRYNKNKYNILEEVSSISTDIFVVKLWNSYVKQIVGRDINNNCYIYKINSNFSKWNKVSISNDKFEKLKVHEKASIITGEYFEQHKEENMKLFEENIIDEDEYVRLVVKYLVERLKMEF